MNQDQITQKLTIRQRRIKYMEHLTNSSYEAIRLEAEEMSLEEAQRIHKLINPNWGMVCLLSGRGGIRRASWTSLVRKMGLIEDRAKGAST